jgi:hypothetical protein
MSLHTFKVTAKSTTVSWRLRLGGEKRGSGGKNITSDRPYDIWHHILDKSTGQRIGAGRSFIQQHHARNWLTDEVWD